MQILDLAEQPYSDATASIWLFVIRLIATPSRRASRSRYFSPISMAFTRSVVLMTCLILLRAREVLTSASQSLLGRWPGLRQDLDHVAVAQRRTSAARCGR